MRIRRAYYDLFSHVYDRVIAMHSGDATAAARDFLVERAGVEPGSRVLDLCTGTGAVALRAQQAVDPGGFVVGLDLSRDEKPVLWRFFGDVGGELSPTGRSKLVRGAKHEDVVAG